MPALLSLLLAGLPSSGRALIFKQDPYNPYNSSFVSVNGLMCVEGPRRIAEGALALKKAGVLGELYNGIAAQPAFSCSQRGYTVSIGEDPCYPGAQNFVRSFSDVAAFNESSLAAEVAYAMSYNLPPEKMALMKRCVCHPLSALMASRTESCANINLTSSWAHHDPFNREEAIICNEGPFQYNTYVLAILKSTAQLVMHRFDQIAPVSCAEMGFPVTKASGIEDHCFGQNHMFFRTRPMMNDTGIQRSNQMEQELFFEDGTFAKVFAKIGGLDTSVLGLEPGCNCLGDSQLGRDHHLAYPGAIGDCNPTELTTSPIRDWFNGQWADGQVNIGV